MLEGGKRGGWRRRAAEAGFVHFCLNEGDYVRKQLRIGLGLCSGVAGDSHSDRFVVVEGKDTINPL